jgi:hypothetical protein
LTGKTGQRFNERRTNTNGALLIMKNTDEKLSPQLRRLIVRAVLNGSAGPAPRLREHEIAHFGKVDRLIRRLSGLSDADFALWSDLMLDGAEPGSEPNVLRIIEDTKTARAAKPSS